MMSDTYLTPDEAARYLRCSVSTLAKLRVYGGGPKYTSIGRGIRYRLADLDGFMESRVASSTSEIAEVDSKRVGETRCEQ
jgi:excisionase family DNA binding protein